MLSNQCMTEKTKVTLCHPGETIYRLNMETRALETLPDPFIIAEGAMVVLVSPARPCGAVQAPGLDITELRGETISLGGAFEVTAKTPNALVLDMCSYRVDGGAWQPELYVMALQQKMIKGRKNGRVEMKFAFDADYIPEKGTYGTVEFPEKCRVTANGTELTGDCGYFFDKSFRKLCLDGLLKKGRNEIVVERDFVCSEYIYRLKNDMQVHEAEVNRAAVETELEGLYLIGDFAVSGGGIRPGANGSIFQTGPFAIGAPQEKLTPSDLTVDGYPFFSGDLTLRKTFTLPCIAGKRVCLQLNEPGAMFVCPVINGHPLDQMMWKPWRAEITDYIREGENKLELQLFSTARNLMGPHHKRDGEVFDTGPNSFYDKNYYTDDYNLLPFGIGGPVSIILCED